MNKNLLYRRIPKVDVLLEDEKIRELTEQYSYDTVLEAVREELDKLRALILSLIHISGGISRCRVYVGL